MPAPDLTIAILHHGLRGYPEDCIESLGPLPAGTELLLVQTDSAGHAPAGTRVISIRRDASRAAAKNLAIAEAKGEYLLLVTSDSVARPGTVERLRKFLGETGEPAVVSARLLQENGMPRRSRKPPVAGPVQRAQALHATFLMARRETFRSVGEFAEGYRFFFEDLEWSWRARGKGVALCFCPEAPACKLAPQLKGELSPELCLALEASQLRCAVATRGRAYARAFRATRASKSLALWLGAAGLNLLFCNASEFLAAQAGVHRAIWKMRADATLGAELPADAESCVRWETLV